MMEDLKMEKEFYKVIIQGENGLYIMFNKAYSIAGSYELAMKKLQNENDKILLCTTDLTIKREIEKE